MDVDKDLIRLVWLLREKTGASLIDCKRAIIYARSFPNLSDESLVLVAEKYIKDNPFCLPTG